MPLVEVNSGVRIYYEDWGQGRPVVMIHGWPLNHQMFEYQALFLASQGLRVITYDLRGFGNSDKPWRGCDYDTWCKDLSELLESLNLKNVLLCGFSMGGAIAMHYVASSHDPRITQLALLAAAGPCLTQKQNQPQGVPKETLDQFVKLNWENRLELYTQFGKKFFFQPLQPEFSSWMLAMGMKSSIHASIRGIEEFRDHDLRHETASIQIPTRIFHGTQDQIVPFNLTEVQTKLIPHATLVPFEKSGHGLFLDEKDKLNRELLDFGTEDRMKAAA